MLEEKKRKLKEMLSFNLGKNNKRKIENLVVFVIILIVTIIIINSVWKKDSNKESEVENDTDTVLAQEQKIEEKITSNELEQKLKNILQKIEGVGKVDVLLTYSQSSQTVAMYNEDSTKNNTEETDTRSVGIEK